MLILSYARRRRDARLLQRELEEEAKKEEELQRKLEEEERAHASGSQSKPAQGSGPRRKNKKHYSSNKEEEELERKLVEGECAQASGSQSKPAQASGAPKKKKKHYSSNKKQNWKWVFFCILFNTKIEIFSFVASVQMFIKKEKIINNKASFFNIMLIVVLDQEPETSVIHI